MLNSGSIFDDKYRVEKLLGQGGYGCVYKAIDLSLGRTVALKVLREAFGLKSEESQRFQREARLVCSLKHKNIVDIMHFGIADNQLYFAMEFIEGRPLSILLAEGPQSVSDMLNWCTPVAEALEFAHGRDVVHRDIKPENIMIDENFGVKILDFGLAKSLNSVEIQKLTQTGLMIGSVFYLSPEQAQGEKITEKTDVYSLACVIYQALTGKRPFDGDTAVAVAWQHVHAVPPRLSENESVVSLPRDFDELIVRCLSKDAKARPSMSELLDALREAKGAPEIHVKKSRVRPLSTQLTVTAILSGFVSVLLVLIASNTFKSSKTRIASQILLSPSRELIEESKYHYREKRYGLASIRGNNAIDAALLQFRSTKSESAKMQVLNDVIEGYYWTGLAREFIPGYARRICVKESRDALVVGSGLADAVMPGSELANQFHKKLSQLIREYTAESFANEIPRASIQTEKEIRTGLDKIRETLRSSLSATELGEIDARLHLLRVELDRTSLQFDYNLQSKSMRACGELDSAKHDYVHAFPYYASAARLMRLCAPDTPDEAACKMSLARCFHKLGLNSLAIAQYKSAESIARISRDNSLVELCRQELQNLSVVSAEVK